jgi:5-methyltetrahydrofolate--homocysteine methyltransferase
MRTVLRSASKEVRITTDRPVVVIGEKINPTGRKRLAAALQAHDLAYIEELATAQVAAGADVLDVNVGVPGIDDVAVLAEVVRLLGTVVDVPLCLDSPNPAALQAALPLVPGKPLVNSVNGEEKSLRSVLPLVKDRGAAVIGLTMDEAGIPATAEARTAIAGKILERAAALGIPAEDVIIDPLVLTVGSDHMAATVTLATIQMVRKEFGVNINLGASNVSFGLPDRELLNGVFLGLAIQAGLNAPIVDAEKVRAYILAADLAMGKDEWSMRYITAFRQRQQAAQE